MYVNARNANHAYDGQGIDGGGLLAGGFDNTVMNTGLTTVAPGSTSVQSKHVVTGGTGTIWGYGAIDGTVAGNPGLAGVKLECTDCHNPHGNSGSNGQATYRILRSRPMVNGTAAPVAVDVADQTTKNYTVAAANTAFDGTTSTTAFPNNYFVKYGYSSLSGFCAQCHTKHAALSGAYAVDSGDTIFKYRHKGSPNHTDCTDCHVSHGSSAKAEGFAAQVNYPSTDPNAPHENSSLLRLDNRGVCYQCHGQSFLSPEVGAVSPASGKADGTVAVTVSGVKFGTTQGTGNVKIGLIALTVSTWSATSITGTVPAGVVTGTVKVTTANGLSNRTGPTFTVTP